MEQRNYSVYRHTTPNNKVYIGITGQRLSRRWSNGQGYRKNTYFFKAINKYGWQNIKHEVLFSELTKQEACEIEVELIKFYDSTNPAKGYNLTSGGETGTLLNPEALKRHSEKSKQLRHSEETKRRMSERQKGEKAYWYGKQMPIEARKKLSNSKKGKPAKNKKTVYQYDLNMNLIGQFESLAEASKHNGLASSTISVAIKQNRFVGGHYWKYKEEIK